MLESMTGFGRGEFASDRLRAVAEIRSVNNRYCEISVKLPWQLQNHEQVIREKVHKKLKRGKITITVMLQHLGSTDQQISIPEEALAGRIRTLERIRELAGITEPVKLEHLLSFRELFETGVVDPELIKEQAEVVENAVMEACDELLIMRRQEGLHLQNDLEERVRLLSEHCKTIQSKEKDRLAEAHKKLKERIGQMLEDQRVDPDRMEMEMAILADRLDISEELVRMGAHLNYFSKSLHDDSSQGKKLNFILQEMHREINTIGSKANHSGISHTVVEMKEIIETLREQVQNIA